MHADQGAEEEAPTLERFAQVRELDVARIERRVGYALGVRKWDGRRFCGCEACLLKRIFRESVDNNLKLRRLFRAGVGEIRRSDVIDGETVGNRMRRMDP